MGDRWRPCRESRLSPSDDHDPPRPRRPHAARPVPERGALETFDDGAVAFDADGTILATGPSPTSAQPPRRRRSTTAATASRCPGFVDTHVHFPQIAVIGAMGLQLLDWLAQRTLPEEARMADPAHARRTAQRFVACWRANGTTTALVFGAHFPHAQQALFEEADERRPADRERPRRLRPQPAPDLEVTPDVAYDAEPGAAATAGTATAACATRSRRASACPAAKPMLDACRTLLDETPGALFTSHVNESPGEIDVRPASCSPTARDYIDTYERAGLLRRPLGPGPQRPCLRRRAAAARRRTHAPSRTARPRTPSWPPGSSRWRATSSTACASGWAPTSARAPA